MEQGQSSKAQDTTPNPEDATLKGKGSPPEKKEPSPKEPPKTYTQEDVDKQIQFDRMQRGRDWKSLETERDNLRGQVEDKESKLKVATDKLESLKTQIDELASDDPDKLNLVKKLREAEGAMEQATAKLKEAEAKEASIAESQQEITKWKRDQLVYTVADEFVTANGEPIDFDSFMSAADKFKLGEREDLVLLAETLGFKSKSSKPTATPAPTKPYSGITEGGSETLEGKSRKQLFRKAYSK